ncbi:type IV pilin protein [Azotobacter chroococcum]|uniref:Type 4 fimbrial biogenesis transmembrane protein (PilE) n=1 Tax=Azotobacter chroococcum NCIMB 8003 TaxID=1328314 RepID=A0A0C4WK94_9GAMM|nr:type IV pilin protein [Azotobacter chroococcum]AJE20456.1 Type 4 fimbrial biogenesis transmembrane protein (PilE) [Azotobacter chroococcum NCIMB 8003]TKD37090.1 prepilin-type N-terminal cleavage/methylation domain-containing protein [Azotobacter chroococcum]
MERNKRRGFTLIELMITVAIVAILAAIAYPSYQQYVLRGNRGAAQGAMMEIASRQQQFLLANRAYADETELENSGYALPSEVADHYDYKVVVGIDTLPSFTITFTAKGAQEDDGDLSLNSEGVRTPPDKW